MPGSRAGQSEQMYETSDDFVVVETPEDTVSGAVDVLADGGRRFAIVPKAKLKPDQTGTITPALVDTQSGEVVVPTGKLTVRWKTGARTIGDMLKKTGARLERDYGAGGIVSPPPTMTPIEFAQQLESMDEVERTQVQVLRKAYRK